MSPSRRFAGVGAQCTGPEREGTHVRHPSISCDPVRPPRGTRPDVLATSSAPAPNVDRRSLEGRALLSTFTVNSLGDTGTGSGFSGDLRYVITQVDQTPGDNTINFAVTGTITLNSALPHLSNSTGVTDIEGPGASSLTVARNTAVGTPLFPIFTIDAGARVELAGLAITGANFALSNTGVLTVTNSTIANNNNGIYNDPGGILTVTNCTIANNLIAEGIQNSGMATIDSSVIEDNSGGDGGGITNYCHLLGGSKPSPLGEGFSVALR